MNEITPTESNQEANKVSLLIANKIVDHSIMQLINEHQKKGKYFYSLNDLGSTTPIKRPPKYILDRIKPYLFWVANYYMIKLYGQDMGLITFTKAQTTKTTTVLTYQFTDLMTSRETIKVLLLFVFIAFQDKFYSSEQNKIVISKLNHILTVD